MTSISDTEVVNAPGGLVELGYSQITSGVSVTGTDVAVIGDLTVVCDGSPIAVEFYSPRIDLSGTTLGDACEIYLWVDGVKTGRIAERYHPNAATGPYTTTYGVRRLTPAAGSHTFKITATRQGTTSPTIGAGAGTTITQSPAFLRVSKILQASQLLVTQSNAPLVTQLPSGNLVDGQRVDLYANNVVYPERWNSSASAWNVVGAPNIQQGVSNTSQTYSTASTWQNTNLSVSITPSSTTSRIMLNMSAFLSTSAASVLGEWRIIRNSTTVVSPSRTGPATGQTINGLIPDFNTNRGLNGIPFVTLDSPASTSAQTYTLQVYPNGAISVYLNRWGLDANWGATSSIIAQEIPA